MYIEWCLLEALRSCAVEGELPSIAVFGQASKYDIIIIRWSLAYCEIGAQMRFVCVPNLHVRVYPTYSFDNLLLFAIVHLHLLDLTISPSIRGEHRPPQQCHSGLAIDVPT